MLRSLLLTTLALSIASIAGAQWQGNVFVEDQSIKAYTNLGEKQIAWAGGFSNPQFAMADMNDDNLVDMVVYEPWLVNLTRVFLNRGTNAVPIYEYSPFHAKPFNDASPYPIVTDYMKLVDYNRDKIPDLVTKGGGGFTIYKGKRINGRVEFTYYKELRYNSPFGTINAYSQPSDIPAVADMDNDGDLDFLSFNEDGAIMYYFKNCQEEYSHSRDSISICKPTNCWGHVTQQFVREYILGNATGSLNCPTINNYSCKGCLHAGNTICLVDMDGDGDQDLLNGNISYNDLQYLKNGRIETARSDDSIIYQDTLWQTGGVRVNVSQWPAAFLEDVDGDGKKDLLVAPHAFNVSENYKTIILYKNMGTTTVPNFVYQHDTFLVDKTLDFGSKSYPVLYDYDKDGKLDLFVGGGGFYQNGGTYRSKIAYFKGRVVGGVTRFDLQTPDFMNIFAENVQGAFPAFGDLNNDGKDDLIVGHTDGTIKFYQNNASSATVQPVFTAGIPLVDENAVPINPTGNVSPVIYDINADGKPDLLATGDVGTVFYYRNSSTAAGALSLTYITDTLGGMHAASYDYSYGTMYIGKMDNTGKTYIVLGNEKGTLRRYTGFEGGNVTVPYQLFDDKYSNIDIHYASAVTFGDVDGNGKFEMFLGSSLGGVQQFRQDLIVSPNPPPTGPNTVGTAHNKGICSVFPNPAKDYINLNWDNDFAVKGEVNIRVINITGQILVQKSVSATDHAVQISVEALPAGIYNCVVQSGSNIYSQNMMLKK